MKASQLLPDEFNSYYGNYILMSGDDGISKGLLINLKDTIALLESISEDKLNYVYADGKWTIKEIIIHLIDSERVFAYRALRFARKDQTNLPGYDQDEYIPTSNAKDRTIQSLIAEYEAVRNATVALFESFNNEMLMEKGTANNSPMSVRALGFIIVGHERHHSKIIKERYL